MLPTEIRSGLLPQILTGIKPDIHPGILYEIPLKISSRNLLEILPGLFPKILTGVKLGMLPGNLLKVPSKLLHRKNFIGNFSRHSSGTSTRNCSEKYSRDPSRNSSRIPPRIYLGILREIPLLAHSEIPSEILEKLHRGFLQSSSARSPRNCSGHSFDILTENPPGISSETPL